jgi:two-component system nitrogen regulation response regulator GlnG
MAGRTESIDAIIGTAPALTGVVRAALRIAPTGIPVLVSGESGTGKELLARVLHDYGAAADGPFVAVNCGTLPRDIADSELFGHERGAFTGAAARKVGWFEEADGGTLVLDEIGELPLELQPKLLRVLETGRLRRVGGNGEIAVRVRLVALTLRDLPRDIERGLFRADLYHRLAGFELVLPPLRQRRADIPALVARFLAEFEPELGRRAIDPVALAALGAYDWPGNVRQLRNVVRRAAVNCPHTIVADALELPLPHAATGGPPVAATPSRATASHGPWSTHLADEDGPAPPPTTLPEDVVRLADRTFDEIERSIYDWALRRNGGSRRQAARALGVARSTFCDKVKRYGIA